MEGRYPPGLFMTLIDCTDASKENAFNHWYNEVLIPAFDSLDAVQNIRRYKNVLSDCPTFQGRPKYLTLIEVYQDDLTRSLQDIHKCENKISEGQNGFSKYIAKVNTIYRRFGPEFKTDRSGDSVQAIYCGLLGCADPSREDEFNKWYNERHSPETVKNDLFSFDTGYRYKVVDPADPIPHQSAPYLTLYETSLDKAEALEGLTALRKNSVAVNDTLWVELLRVYFTGLFSPIDN